MVLQWLFSSHAEDSLEISPPGRLATGEGEEFEDCLSCRVVGTCYCLVLVVFVVILRTLAVIADLSAPWARVREDFDGKRWTILAHPLSPPIRLISCQQSNMSLPCAGSTALVSLGAYTYISGTKHLQQHRKAIDLSRSKYKYGSRRLGVVGLSATLVAMGIYRTFN